MEELEQMLNELYKEETTQVEAESIRKKIDNYKEMENTDMYKEIKRKFAKPDITEYNNAMSYLYNHFTSEPGFKKGAALFGDVGLGKTFLINMMQKALYPFERGLLSSKSVGIKSRRPLDSQKRPFTASKLVAMFNEYGYSYYDKLSAGCPIFLDEVGREPIGSHYGTTCNVVADLISKLYEDERTLHFTTNMNAKDFTAKYGIDVADRLREMCQSFTFYGESLRN